MRRWRRWLAALMILGFASAQFISLAHACMNGLDIAHGMFAHASSEAPSAMPADCPAMTHGEGTSHALCDAVCVPREQADQPSDIRIALAPPSFLVVRRVTLVAPNVVHAAPPRATIASPPRSLLFSRFLI